MYKILIVDDEARIRNGLSNIIEWEVYGIEIAGLAADGMKAYLEIKSNHPDIVLVDISMPNMTGLELIELCSHMEVSPKFIILSGYNDFEYVQKAIKLGAVDYLLKPVDQDELIHAVSSCVKLLDEDRAHQRQFQESCQALRNDLLMRILHNQIDLHEFREKSHVVNLSLYCSRMRVGVLALIPDSDNASVPLMQAVQICQDICSSLCPCYVVADVNTNIAVIFKASDQSITEEAFHNILAECSKSISEHFGYRVLFSVGRDANHINGLPASYTDCISKLEKKMILGDVLEDKLSKSPENHSSNYRDFLTCLESGKEEEISSTLHACCRSFLPQKEETDINFFKYQLIDLVTYVLRSQYPSAYFLPELEEKKKQAFNIIRSTDSILKLEEKLTAFFISLTEKNPELPEEANYPHIIQYVLAKIRSDYSDNSLSLKTVAAQLDVNPAYLGREFTLVTGEYFSDFLNRTRITKAIHLLNTTSLKTGKIAEAVGFTNSSYFFTVFKKITGKNPGDYRVSNK